MCGQARKTPLRFRFSGYKICTYLTEIQKVKKSNKTQMLVNKLNYNQVL